ncbi:hypothetical protein BIV57_22465 [Mangrovactinospora gilvigrisea]|uniref:Integral membrane protein n=1 Tax=Mangrovactinospora gilvigrisea TaxID=1428644 RepID=A0A1J7B9J8_9ACTN|nr:hypothetical protein [Mangrovactinospora gilvigrisea]OIV35269.1 hypothetical protein BIV57_22465 [Mangrovactinospora gilvigrisea]
MGVLIQIFVVLHLVGVASLLGGFLTQMKQIKGGNTRVTPAMMHGALTMLVTGLALVGLNDGSGHQVDHVKIGVKLVVLLVILGLVYVNRGKEKVSTAVTGSIALLTLANMCIAVMWN